MFRNDTLYSGGDSMASFIDEDALECECCGHIGIHGRTTGAIRARLKKLKLIE